MKIAIFDHLITNDNAIGKCHRELLLHLADEHEFTVFAVEFDNPRPDRIRYVHVPALRYPLLGLMMSFHITAPFILWWYQHIKKEHFDIVQSIGGNFIVPDIAYGHFCHRVYLYEHADARPKQPIRRIYSWVYDFTISLLEPFIYKKARYIVTPSSGLARELQRNFSGATEDKIHVIANPVNVQHMLRPADFDPHPVRESLQFCAEDFVLVFVGAGHFERKGLPIIMDAMNHVTDPRVKLAVVGGSEYLVDQYEAIAHKKGLADRIRFVGFQHDIRPYLWASDLFVFPSAYEVFPLVSLEAAASSLPLLCAPLNGVEEFLQDGYNGWEVERKASLFAEKIYEAFTHRNETAKMGQQAVATVMDYTPRAFGHQWRLFYDRIASEVETQSPQKPTPPSVNRPYRTTQPVQPSVHSDKPKVKLHHD